MSKYNGSFTKTETINTPVLQKSLENNEYVNLDVFPKT